MNDKLVKILLKNIDEKQLMQDLAEEFFKDGILKVIAPIAIEALAQLLKDLETKSGK